MHVDDQKDDEEDADEAPVKSSAKQKRARKAATGARTQAIKRKASKLASTAADEDDADEDDADMHAAENNGDHDHESNGAAKNATRVTKRQKTTTSANRARGKQAATVSGDGELDLEDIDPENADADPENGDNSVEGRGGEGQMEGSEAVVEPKVVNKLKRQVGNNRLGGKAKEDGRGDGKRSEKKPWCTQVCCLILLICWVFFCT